MKKIVLFLVICFASILNINAISINSIDASIIIDENGVATVEETWIVVRQKDTIFQKDFKNAKGIKITDISVKDAKASSYHEVKKIDKKDQFCYMFKDSGNKKYIRFNTEPGENIYTISYKVENIITKFTETYALDFFLIPRNGVQFIGSYTATIKTPYDLNETNTGMYIYKRGKSSVQNEFVNGSIVIKTNNIDEKSELRILSNFNEENISFTNANTVDKSYQETVDSVKTGRHVIETIIESFTSEVIIAISSVILILIVIIIIAKLLARRRKHNEYFGILPYKDKNMVTYEEAAYIENVPLNNDLYSIGFIGGYYQIINNRSNLISALVLRWLFDGLIELELDKARPYIKFNLNIALDRKLDNDLYKMLIEASTGNMLDSHKMHRFAKQHYLRLMTWFNMGFNESISSEMTRGTITKEKRMGKIYTQMGEKTVDYANEIQGLKKYLLNFNQVPRQTELTEREYINLLVSSELLGISSNVAGEILRKNPDNVLAKKVMDFNRYRDIFKNIYDTILIPYKEFAKDSAFLEAYEDEEEKNN